MWDLLWITLAAVGLFLYGLLRARERFVIKVGNPFKDQELISFGRHAKGTRVIGFYPDTCPAHKPELHQGLCYKPCPEGYYGIGPVCWAETKNIGAGMFAKLKSCKDSGYPAKDGWVDMGLSCFRPPRIDTAGKGLRFWDWDYDFGDSAFKMAECPPGAQQAKELKRIADMVRAEADGTQRRNVPITSQPDPDAYSDAVGGMCYKRCPRDKPNHVSGAPYLCYKNSVGRGLSYERGVGDIPPLFILGEG